MKNIYAIVLVAAAVAFTVFAFWGNSRKSRENRAAQAEAVSDWMTFQGMASSYDLSGLPVTDDNGETMSFADIGAGGTAVGIYVSRTQCTSCWERDLKGIKAIADTVEGMKGPFVLADGFNPRDIKLMKKDKMLNLPVYATAQENNETLSYLATSGRTFLFTVQPQGRMTNIIFYDKAIAPCLGGFLRKVLNGANTAKENNGKPTAGLDIKNPVIHLGEIPARRKFALVYRLENNSGRECVIEDVKASCDCISGAEHPDRIAAGGTAEIKVTYVSTGLGDFMRDIEVKTNLRSQPYVLEFDGTIK